MKKMKYTGLPKVLGEIRHFARRWWKNRIFIIFEREFLQNTSTDFFKNFTDVFLSTKICLGLEKSIVSAKIIFN